MRISQASGLAVALVAAFLTGCGTSTPPRYYDLASTAGAGGGSPLAAGVLVGPVSVPASVDRPEFVLQVAPNRVAIQEFDLWASPLAEAIAHTVAGDLAALLGTPDVATAPFANFPAAWRVTVSVQRFESLPGEAAVLDAVWAVRPTAGGDARSGRTVAREAVQGEGFEALAAAHSRALARLSAEVADALRAAARATP